MKISFRLSKRQLLISSLMLVISLLVILALVSYRFLSKEKAIIPSNFQEFRLVKEKIPQSAPIKVFLPPGISHEYAIKNIKFEPAIKGEWLVSKSFVKSVEAVSQNSNVIVFKPHEKLSLDSYYLVNLTLPTGEDIRADFLVVEDPKLVNIFPRGDYILPDSEITFVFNRPVVPLTNLDNPNLVFPVQILPSVEGKFRWISTNVLQFRPQPRFQLSSKYEVIVKDFIGVDDVVVKGGKAEFFTEKINLLYINGQKIDDRKDKESILIRPNWPIKLNFNQPVDINKLSQNINIKNSKGYNVPIVLEYFKIQRIKSTTTNQETSKKQNRFMSSFLNSINFLLANVSVNLENLKEEEIDRTTVLIYPQRNKFGREKFWDYEEFYTLKIENIHGLEGNLFTAHNRTYNIKTPSVIDDDNTFQEVKQTGGFIDKYILDNQEEIFDPKNRLIISFYEDVDLTKSQITSPYLKEITYHETTTKNRIAISFKNDIIKPGEVIKISFDKIYAVDGILLNEKPIVKSLYIYSRLKVISDWSYFGKEYFSPEVIVICTNNNLKGFEPYRYDMSNRNRSEPEDYVKLITDKNEEIKIKDINEYSVKGSYYFDYRYGESKEKEIKKFVREGCKDYRFYYIIDYELTPFTKYKLTLNVVDMFDQVTSLKFDITTDDISSSNKILSELFNNYTFTLPDKTKFKFVSKNLRRVDLEICKVAPEEFIRIFYWKRANDRIPIKRSEIECLDKAKDSFSFNTYWKPNYIQFDLKEYFSQTKGHYVFIVRSEEKTRYSRGEISGTEIVSFVTVSDLVLISKKVNVHRTISEEDPEIVSSLNKIDNIVWLLKLPALETVKDANITLVTLNDNGSVLIKDNKKSNANGVISFEALKDIGGIIATKGDSSAVLLRDVDYLYIKDVPYAENPWTLKKFYVYTDKPIYRPSQEVFIKGIVRVGYDGNYEIPRRSLSLLVRNPQQNTVFSQKITLNENGTFNTKFILPSDASLGRYEICFAGEKERWDWDICRGSFDVEEYVPAAFKVELISDKDEYVLGERINLQVNANYYFGLPVRGAEVEYSILTQDYYFDKYQEEYYDFGQQYYYEFYDYDFCCGDRFIYSSKTKLDDNGRAIISIPLTAEKLFGNREKPESKILIFESTIKNELGQSIRSQKSFIVHLGDFYIGLKTDKFAASKNEPFKLMIKTVNLEGRPVSISNILVELVKHQWIYEKRQEADGSFYENWKKTTETVKTVLTRTDKQGKAHIDLVLADEGEYEIVVSASDSKNNKISNSHYFYVWSSDYVQVISPSTFSELDLKVENRDLKVGQRGKLIIKSPFEKSKALITIERGKLFDYWLIDVESSLKLFEFNVKSEYIPNIFASVILISPTGKIAHKAVKLNIDNELNRINIEVKSDKKKYLPGEEVMVEVKTTDWQGKPISAEVSLAVVDMSILALKGNPKKNPLAYFYDGFPLTIITETNLANLFYELEYYDDSLVNGKGGGGLPAAELEARKRGIFKETALWLPEIKTDKNGKATIKFKLPDNLTSWQIEAVGATKDTKVGVGYEEFKTQKRLMVIPLKPRFIVPGDDFLIGLQVFNNSDKKQDLKVKIESKDLVVKDDAEKRLSIKADDVEVIYFKVKAPENSKNDYHHFTISAIGNEYRDIVENSIRVLSDITYETVVSSGYITPNVYREVIYLPPQINSEKGYLKIKVGGTLTLFIKEAVNYLIDFPYGCTEQIASQLRSIYVAKKIAQATGIKGLIPEQITYQGKKYSIDEAVNIGLSKIYQHQNLDGGFGFWDRDRSHLYLTIYVVEVLENLESLGYSISPGVIENALGYIAEYAKLDNNSRLDRNLRKKEIVQLGYHLTNIKRLNNIPSLIDEINRLVDDNKYLNNEISNDELVKLAIIYEANNLSAERKSKIFNLLENRLQIDGRGAYLPLSRNYRWEFFETKARNTALYLKLNVIRKKDDQINQRVLRWLLLNKKDTSEIWRSTQDTVEILDAFADYLIWKGETRTNFDLNVLLNKTTIGSFKFNPQNILNVFEIDMPINALKFGQNNSIEILKSNEKSAYYYDAELRYYQTTVNIPARDEGFTIFRSFHRLMPATNTMSEPVTRAKSGEVLVAKIKLIVPESRSNVAIEDYIPAGMEIINPKLFTEGGSLNYEDVCDGVCYREPYGYEDYAINGNNYSRRANIYNLYPTYQEIRDDRLFLFVKNLEPGVYEYRYYVRPLVKGRFLRLPSMVWEMYFPENFGRTSAEYFEIE
ncbi:MAG: MG2 domain-containing protein [Patescibacteria group bacterium]|nr:MG2 domain-containing protein [Patescibacteria group bacterium]